jgi:phosphoglycolate phosphatase-like HAD superfamily hydrolase
VNVRYQGEIDGADVRVHALAPILAVDIDGTMADYYTHFRWFAELYTQRELAKCDQDHHWASTDHFGTVLGLEQHEYRTIKLAYRQGGMKRSIPKLDEHIEYIQALRGLGIQVWVATTRPWQRLDNIDPDTQFWLDRNVGRVDGLLYGEDKYDQLVEIAEARGQKVLGVIDDLGANLERAAELGLNTAIRIGPHNARWRRENGTVPVMHSGWSIYNQALEWRDPS